MFVVKTELELAFMGQVALLKYIQAIAQEKMLLGHASEVDPDVFGVLNRSLTEAAAYCDHTNGAGRSLLQESGRWTDNPRITCPVCKTEEVAPASNRAPVPYWSHDTPIIALEDLNAA